ncbi:MAG: peptide chain release factor N(5)-glutamine methyltransferase [Burkholderiales bacterium]|nr:peptide chain release factor N(5)-glutamine methyltransferase [Burkholderiales bacterium]
MVTIGELLAATPVARREARLLLSRSSELPEAILAAFPEREVLPEAASRFRALAARRAAGEPVAYLLGEREFFGRPFKVTPAVLIPRPETELVVERALATVAGRTDVSVADLGTGSGAIAVTLACELPQAQITAVDRCADALEVARANALALAPQRVDFRQGSWYAPLQGRRFTFIVSNPPYIAKADPHPSQGDLRFEPRTALIGGDDGLACLREIIHGAAHHLQDSGQLILEHGYDQGDAVRRLMESAGFCAIATHRDLAGLERVTEARFST